MSPASSKRSASHAAVSHGWLSKKKNGCPGGGIDGYNLHSPPPPPDCGALTTYRLYAHGTPVPIPFHIYTNDQPLHNGTRSFIYADDLCVTAQQPYFVEVETTIEESLSELTQYYRSNNVHENPDCLFVCFVGLFHIGNWNFWLVMA